MNYFLEFILFFQRESFEDNTHIFADITYFPEDIFLLRNNIYQDEFSAR